MATLPDPNFRYAMAKYVTDGIRTDWQISFVGGYISQNDVYAYSYRASDRGDIQAHALTFISVTPTEATVRISPAVAANRKLFIARLTQRGDPLVDFINRSMLTEKNLNTITEQAIYSVAELQDAFRELEGTVAADAAQALLVAQQANTKADTAISTANSAVTIANAADDKAEQAVAGIASATEAANNATTAANSATLAANTATQLVQTIQGEVDAAVNTANAASLTANEASAAANAISDLAEEANDNAAAAVTAANGAITTSNTALAVANGVDGKAQTALDNAATALASANDAVKKTPTAAQTIASNLTANGFLASNNSVASRGDRPASGDFASWRYYITNLVGNVNYGGLKIGRSGGVNHVTLENAESGTGIVIEGNGVNSYYGTANRFFGVVNALFGTVGVQTIFYRMGWSNGVSRATIVLESDASLSLYGYDSSGGSPSRYANFLASSPSYTRMAQEGDHYLTGSQAAYWLKDRSNQSAARDWATYVQDGKYRIYNSTSGDRVQIDLSGGNALFQGLQVVATGGFDTSSYKKKCGLKPLRYGLDEILRIVTREGYYRDAPDRLRLFLVAEQLRNVVPEAVIEYEDGDDKVLAASYTALVPVLVEAVKELTARVRELEARDVV